MRRKPLLKIGTSGWMYNHWKGVFYPSDIASEEMLSFYSRYFDTVEINNTFYKKPEIENIKSWQQRAGSDFIFSVKANRYITHMKNLKEVEKPIKNLLGALQYLKKNLGPILFQLPPRWYVNFSRLKEFLETLPENYLYAVEFRHSSWYSEEVFRALQKNNIAFCIHDHRDAPSPEIMTADFIYLRFHGPGGYYSSKYDDEQLSEWAGKIKKWLNRGRDVYSYFNNDASGYAIENSRQLKQKTRKYAQ